jgi:hypothetical protein
MITIQAADVSWQMRPWQGRVRVNGKMGGQKWTLRGLNLFRVGVLIGTVPRVARSAQPWALGRNPFGILSFQASLGFEKKFLWGSSD